MARETLGGWRLILGVLACTVVVGALVVSRVERRRQTTQTEEALDRAWRPPSGAEPVSVAQLLEQDLGVAVLYAQAPLQQTEFNASAISSKEGDRALYLLLPELRRHSRQFLQAARLRHVLLGTGLSAPNMPGGGIVGLTVAGRTFFVADARAKEGVLTHVFHHELYHLADPQLHADPEWEGLNPTGFAYDRKDAVKMDPSGSMIDRTRFGFISRYATFSAGEDKAELFAFLVTDTRTVRELAARDSVLRRKIEVLEARVESRGGDVPWPR